MYCTNCGTQVSVKAKFCSKCGTELSFPEDVIEEMVTEQKEARKEKVSEKEKKQQTWKYTIPIFLLLLIMLSTAFLPMIKFDAGTTVSLVGTFAEDIKQVVQESNFQNKDEILSYFNEEDVSALSQDSSLEESEEIIKMYFDTERSYISATDLIFHKAQDNPFGFSEDQVEELEAVANVNKGIEMAGTILKTFYVLLLLYVVVFGVCVWMKCSKKVCLVLAMIYSVLTGVISGVLLWGAPGIISEKTWDYASIKLVEAAEMSILEMQQQLGAKLSVLEKLCAYAIELLWNNVLGISFLIMFICSVLMIIYALILLISKSAVMPKKVTSMVLVVGLCVTTMTGCGKSSLSFTEEEMVALNEMINNEIMKLEQNRESVDLIALDSVRAAYAIALGSTQLNYIQCDSTGLDAGIRESIENTLGKSLEEIEKELCSKSCKGQKLFFYHAGADYSVSVGSQEGVQGTRGTVFCSSACFY